VVTASLPRPLVHVGLTVPDLDAAVRWYSEVLGLTVLSSPATVRTGEGYEGAAAADVFKADFGEVRIAHLSCGNGVGLELFEFVRPAVEPSREDHRHTGITHLCFLAPDLEEATERVVQAGGTRLTERSWNVLEGQSYRFSFCRDPWGNVIEFHTNSFEQIFANQG
jgi:catechol 2,3-dioxygenase-like lactoylglutathione lyase family enzyme